MVGLCGLRSHGVHACLQRSDEAARLVRRTGGLPDCRDARQNLGHGAGTEYEELYERRGGDTDGQLIRIRTRQNPTGSVSGFAPPGDIHRVRNGSEQTAISIHIYGADIRRLGSSVRRCYDLPIVSR